MDWIPKIDVMGELVITYCLLADKRCIVPTALRFGVAFAFSGLKSGVTK